MAITPYNLSKGAYVVVNVNGTYANPAYPTRSKNKVDKVVARYNKTTKVGQLTGQYLTDKINNIDTVMVEVLLTKPVKPNFVTTYLKLWFRATNLDIAVDTVKPKAEIPKKVETKAVKKAATTAKKTTTTNTTPTVAPAVSKQDYPDYYDEVPASDNNWTLIVGGVVLIGIGVFFIVKLIKKRKNLQKSKQSNPALDKAETQ